MHAQVRVIKYYTCISVRIRVRVQRVGPTGALRHCGTAHKDIHRWRLHVTSPLLAYCIIANNTLLRKMSETSVKIEEGCRDDTVPKTVLKQEGTARWIESM